VIGGFGCPRLRRRRRLLATRRAGHRPQIARRVSRETEQVARPQAQQHNQDGARGHADRQRPIGNQHGGFPGLAEIAGADDPQVVNRRDRGIDQPDHHKGDHGRPMRVALAQRQRAREDVYLPDEAECRRHTHEAEAAYGHRQRHGRVRACEAGEVVQFLGRPAPNAKTGQRAEHPKVHHAIRHDVEKHRRPAVPHRAAQRGRTDEYRDEHVSRVSDARVGKDPLRVGLNQGHAVAHRHREGCENPDQPEERRRGHPGNDRPRSRRARGNKRQEFDDRHESCGLRKETEQTGDGRSCPLIHIGGIHVQRHGGDLVRQAGDSQQQPDPRAGVPDAERRGHPRKLRRARGAVQEAEPVHEDRRGERAEEEVLQAGLLRADVGAARGHEGIRRHADQLQRKEERGEGVRSGGQRDSRQREKDHRTVLAAFPRLRHMQVDQQRQQPDEQRGQPHIPGQ